MSLVGSETADDRPHPSNNLPRLTAPTYHRRLIIAELYQPLPLRGSDVEALPLDVLHPQGREHSSGTCGDAFVYSFGTSGCWLSHSRRCPTLMARQNAAVFRSYTGSTVKPFSMLLRQWGQRTFMGDLRLEGPAWPSGVRT
jgi:hypothetical protein